MANEVKVGKNESIDSALRRFKRARSQKFASVNITRSPAFAAKRNLRRLASGNIVNPQSTNKKAAVFLAD